MKHQKIFLNAMDTWFSNFIIETFRTDHIPESKNQTEFMGTINDSENINLPMHFKPHIYKFEYNPSFKSEIFSNDIFIYNLDTGTMKEAEYIIKGLKTLRIESEKILILISNIMTWGRTPDKIKSENSENNENNDEIVFIHPEEEYRNEKKEDKNINNENNYNMINIKNNKENSFASNIRDQQSSKLYEQSFNASLMKDGTNQSKLSIKQLQNKSKLSMIKEEKEENKIIVYYTEKDYLIRKPSLKYFEYKYIENEALNLNQKLNIKAYVICPGVIYGYGEKLFYSIFRNALLGFPIEQILLDKGGNIIPTIHMKDLVNVISKVIEKKPSSKYILAFDQTKNNCLKNIIKMVYKCIGDENKIVLKNEENIEKKEDDNNDINNKENKDIAVKEEKNENDENEKENEEKKENNENIENNKPTIHPFFTNKKYQLSEYFPRELLYLNVKILPSEFIKGESKEKDKKYNPLFKWHCPGGIISNLSSLKKEFLKYRNLNSNKIIILGDPYTGKTTISQILSKIFHLPVIDSKIIADFGKKFAGIKTKEEIEKEEEEKKKLMEENNNNNEENKDGINNEENKEKNENEELNKENEGKEKEKNITDDINEEEKIYLRRSSIEQDLIHEIQNEIKVLEEGRAEAEEQYNKRPNKKKTDPPFDDNMYYRFSDELMVKILKQRISENDTSTYGFILDGFPKNYKQVEELFKEDNKDKLNPNSILIFESIEDDVCINRIKNSEEVLKDPKDPKVNILLERANRRLGILKEEKNKEDYKSIKDYFEEEENKKIFENKIKYINGKENSILDIIKDTQEFIIKNNDGKINQIDEGLDCEDYLYDYVKIEEENNPPQEEKEEANNNDNETNNITNKEPEEETKKEINNEEKILNEESKKDNEEKKLEEIKEEGQGEEEENLPKKEKTKLEIEKENEFKLLEKKSEVLRRYLAENVLPLLSLGILHVANERPDDPVEALADYLLAKTFEIKKNEGEENNKNDNDNENIIKEEENKDESVDLKGDKNGLKLELEHDDNNKEEKISRKLSPIHRENSNGDDLIKNNNDNKE